MRFADKRYYVEAYVKCANCGVLVYGDGVSPTTTETSAADDTIYCSDWCIAWQNKKENEGTRWPKLPLDKIE